MINLEKIVSELIKEENPQQAEKTKVDPEVNEEVKPATTEELDKLMKYMKI